MFDRCHQGFISERETGHYNPGQNILELRNVKVQIWLVTDKIKVYTNVNASQVAGRL